VGVGSGGGGICWWCYGLCVCLFWGAPRRKSALIPADQAFSFSFWTGKAMRKTEACGSLTRISPRPLTRALKFSAAALGAGLLLASSAARAEDPEDEDKTFEEKIIEGIMKGIGGTNMDNTGIDYRERSPLVVPPKLDLPPPAAAAADVKAPNWPKDPHEARRKAAIAARKKAKPDP